MPIDATPPTPGRIAVAWVGQGGVFEVAYDAAWPAQPITAIDLTAIAVPSPAFQITGSSICPGGALAGALILASSDPNGDSAISTAEIISGMVDHSVYAFGQANVAWSDVGCPISASAPDGLPSGVHVYTPVAPVIKLDGILIEFQTCQPETSACNGLTNPF